MAVIIVIFLSFLEKVFSQKHKYLQIKLRCKNDEYTFEGKW